MSRPIFIVIILLIAVLAAVFRLQDLAERPMHGDEASNLSAGLCVLDESS